MKLVPICNTSLPTAGNALKHLLAGMVRYPTRISPTRLWPGRDHRRLRGMDLLKPESELPIGVRYKINTTLDEGGAVFTVFKHDIPLVHCLLAVAANDAAYWEFIERLYFAMTDKAPVDWALPEKPASTPWLVVVLLGVHHDLGPARWLHDFERCMVWLLIEDVFHDPH